MPNVTYIQPDGTRRAVDIPDGDSVMSGAMQNNVRGILAECGGVLACATCHVYVDPAWFDHLPPPATDEADMLEATAAERRPTSRLSCQILMTAALDGLVVTVPDSQS